MEDKLIGDTGQEFKLRYDSVELSSLTFIFNFIRLIS